jgi:hypothetical protein
MQWIRSSFCFRSRDQTNCERGMQNSRSMNWEGSWEMNLRAAPALDLRLNYIRVRVGLVQSRVLVLQRNSYLLVRTSTCTRADPTRVLLRNRQVTNRPSSFFLIKLLFSFCAFKLQARESRYKATLLELFASTRTPNRPHHEDA